MTLGPENMESRPGISSHSIYRDIARMDEAQLERYVRCSFSGRRDLGFLPENFWDYNFSMDRYGSSTYGRDAPSPASFLSDFHNTLASVATGSFRIGRPGEAMPDFQFRPKYREVLYKILQEAFEFKGTPTKEQRILVAHAVEAVGALRKLDTFFAMQRQYAAQQGHPLEYPRYLLDDLEKEGEDKLDLDGLAENLIRNKRYGEMRLRYDHPVHITS